MDIITLIQEGAKIYNVKIEANLFSNLLTFESISSLLLVYNGT